MWLARSRPILLLLLAWGISYAGDMAAYTVASVYLYRAGGAGYVGLLGVEWRCPPRSSCRWSAAGLTVCGGSGC